MRRAIAIVVLGSCLLLVVSGCGSPAPGVQEATAPASAVSTAPASSQAPTTSSPDTVTDAADLVRVPDVEGRTDADQVIKAVGLKPKGAAVHGPIEQDAAGFMQAYRQKPAAGSLVKPGSTVTYRYWWESQ